jgi:hypothetical protein
MTTEIKTTKSCSNCLEVKPLSDFVTKKKSLDGRGGVCKPCVYLQKKERFENLPSEEKDRRRKIKAEQTRNSRNSWTPEKREKQNALHCVQDKIRREKLTEEQKQTKREHHNDLQREYYRQKEHIGRKMSEKYHSLKDQVYEKYGNRCSNPFCGWVCEDGSRGCTDRRCLQIDHVCGGGNKDIKSKSSMNAYWKHVLADETGAYQLLCANCNWIKRKENGEFHSLKNKEQNRITDA